MVQSTKHQLASIGHEQVLLRIGFHAGLLVVGTILATRLRRLAQVAQTNVTQNVRSHLRRVATGTACGAGVSHAFQRRVPGAPKWLHTRVRATMTTQVGVLLEHSSTVGHLAGVQRRVESVAVLLHLNGQCGLVVAALHRTTKAAFEVVVPQVMTKTAVGGEFAAAFGAWPDLDASVEVAHMRTQFTPV